VPVTIKASRLIISRLEATIPDGDVIMKRISKAMSVGVSLVFSIGFGFCRTIQYEWQSFSFSAMQSLRGKDLAQRKAFPSLRMNTVSLLWIYPSL
jgi:hypothetical protein